MSIHNSSLLSHTGISDLGDAGIVLIHTQWNDFIVDKLVSGCKSTLSGHGIEKLTSRQVPGAFELPFACKRYYEATRNTPEAPEAIIAFGCIIRGGTPHFEYVCNAVTDGITRLNISLPVPVIFGILTVDSEEQALDRVGGSHGHKGQEAALTALQMIAFNRSLHQ